MITSLLPPGLRSTITLPLLVNGALWNTSLVIDRISVELGALEMGRFGYVSGHVPAEWGALVCLQPIITSLPMLHGVHSLSLLPSI